MQVYCPKCRKAVDGNDIDLTMDRAVCRPCGEIISLAALVQGAPPGRRARPSDLRADVRHEGEILVVTVAPVRLMAIGMLAFAAVWWGFLFTWYSNVLKHPSPNHIALWFPLLHVAAGVYMVWNAARLLLNTTTLKLDRRALVVQDGPVPTGGNCDHATDKIAQFKVGHRTMRSNSNKRVAVVQAVTSDGRAISLAFRFSQDEHAEWIVEELNEHLKEVQRPSMPLTYRG